MNVIIYMAMTANGYIAKEDDNTSFVSENQWRYFHSMVKKMGNIVLGRNAFDIMNADGRLSELGKVKVYVFTNNVHKHDIIEGSKFGSEREHITFMNGTPQDVLKKVRAEGCKEALVAGGASINSLFIRHGLVNEIYLDVSPVLLGRGIKLFQDADFEAKLELVSLKSLSENEVQLHYRLLKKSR